MNPLHAICTEGKGLLHCNEPICNNAQYEIHFLIGEVITWWLNFISRATTRRGFSLSLPLTTTCSPVAGVRPSPNAWRTHTCARLKHLVRDIYLRSFHKLKQRFVKLTKLNRHTPSPKSICRLPRVLEVIVKGFLHPRIAACNKPGLRTY